MTQRVSSFQALAYSKLTNEYQTIRQIGFPETTLDALVQRGYADVINDNGVLMYKKGNKTLWT